MANISTVTLSILAVATGIWVFCSILRVASRCGLSTAPPVLIVSNDRSLSRFYAGYRAKIQILDEESSQTGFLRIINRKGSARILDMSDYGARVRFPSELPVGTKVRMRIPEISSAATGCVKTCVKVWFGYRIGLEFRGSLYKTSV